MQRVSLRLYWTGACRHPEVTTRRDGSWRPCAFPMHAAVIDRGGELTVVDPGYAPRFFDATQGFPDRLYRWATPAVCPPGSALAAQLKAEGRLEAVQRVVLTHFHADHMAGLADFPDVEVVCSAAAWDAFQERRGLRAVASGQLARLAPTDLASRIRPVEGLPRAQPFGSASLGTGFDLFGDGGVILLPLPGHSAGQIGVALKGEDHLDRLLVADAIWSVDALQADQPPPWATLRFLGDPKVYRRTWRTLAELAGARPDLRMIPAHCVSAARLEGLQPV